MLREWAQATNRDPEIDQATPSKKEPGKHENFKYIPRTNDKSLKLIFF